MMIFRPRFDTVWHPRSGQSFKRLVLQAPAWVNVVARTPEGKYVFVKQYRFGTECMTWELPGGMLERNEPNGDAGHRELREETGLEVDEIEFVVVQDCVEPPEFERSAHFLLMNYTARSCGGQVVLNDEAEAFRWIDLEESLSLDLNEPTRVLVEEVRARRNGIGAY